MTTPILASLALAAVLAVARVVRPGSLVDRILGIDLLLYVIAAMLAVDAVATGSGALLDAPLVIALLGTLGTVAAAIWLDRRGTGEGP